MVKRETPYGLREAIGEVLSYIMVKPVQKEIFFTGIFPKLSMTPGYKRFEFVCNWHISKILNNEMFAILTTKFEWVVRISRLLYMGSSRLFG